MLNKWRAYTKFDFTVDEGKERLDPSREKNLGKHRRRKVEEKSFVTFPLCGPGWYVHKPDVQNKWDDNTHKHTHTHTHTHILRFSTDGLCKKVLGGLFFSFSFFFNLT